MFSSSPFVDLFVSIVVVAITVASFVDFPCCPSSLHICLLSLVGVPQPLETRYHTPS